MPRTSHRAGAVLLPLLLVVLAACSAGPSGRPPVAFQDGDQQVAPAPQPPKPAPVPELGGPSDDMLLWSDCTDQTRAELGELPPGMTVSCSQLLSTLDSPEAPERGTARNALLRVGTGQRVPLVVAGDVGGEPGTTFAARMAAQLPELLNTFDIIGMDRRGTGESDPAACVPQPQREAIVDFDARATDRAQLDRLLESVLRASQECLLDLDERLQAYDTWRAASDLEELRLDLGVPKLHAIGRGEASRLLTTYAERFPTSVGRMVLDGAPDPTRDAIGQAEHEAQAAEHVFDVFAADCAGRGCPLGPEPRKTVDGLVERTRQTPLPAGSTTIGSGRVVQAILLGLSDRKSWPALADALAAADRGDGAGLAALSAPLVTAQGINPPWLDGELITSCNDTTLRVPPQRAGDLATDWVNRFPLFGGAAVQRLVWCGSWPVPQQPLPAPRRPDLPPIPVISTANDPLVLEAGSEHMAEQLPTGVLVRWQGSGHGAVARSRCVTDAVTRFLLQGTVPTDGMACPE
ncbi:TAP-like protein [Saccharopolyspora antimicrobica]|uniref:TAP-like protein n=1 Tax=Saccharopolyspora antimicrobica TaxID=455193 RepID=A0A1I5HVA4_9PSEU|nr:alpha/beta hydrolase [Saccharopolyspora antimicrobica]RKT82319.1 TAP-like protein [Saccharopolyspora antimicrobica]SFO51846.1 TAP-like protein [Saccharopolyspora antimicrobica]